MSFNPFPFSFLQKTVWQHGIHRVLCGFPFVWFVVKEVVRGEKRGEINKEQ